MTNAIGLVDDTFITIFFLSHKRKHI